ncbi:MAG: HAD-IIA family hydrolase [Ardenticatenaceae bacterium]|nr:HAD-IIA family hydrolase [Ardenticatenaceae bacterium]
MRIKNLILDMDGVLWRGDTPMPGLADFFSTLDQLAMGYALATNNASKTIAQYEEKLGRFGVRIDPRFVLTSAEATASYVAREMGTETAVYIIGEDGLHEAFGRRGFPIVTVMAAATGATADVVVFGFNRNLVYNDLAMGVLLVQKGAKLIGTNPDVTFPHELGLLPGAGSTQAFLEAATGEKALVIGKPGRVMFEEALQRLGGTTADTAMVGDRLNTDIAGGKAAGLTTIMVLSGISKREEAVGDMRPDYVFADISELAAHLKDGWYG